MFFILTAILTTLPQTPGAHKAPPNGSRSGQAGINSVSLADIRLAKPREVAQQVLQSVPASASLVVHFDIDCLQSREMPAAYFPHTEGMTLPEVGAPGRFS